jgi:hypothetical protein
VSTRAGELPAHIEGGLRNLSLTQRPGAVSAIHNGLLMTTRSREARAGRCTATARAGWSPWPALAPSPAAALRCTRRITYRFTGSPAHRLTGHKDQRGENDCQWPHGKGDSRPSDQPCLPHSARIRPRRSLAGKVVVNPGRDLAHFRVSDGCRFYWPTAAEREILDLIAAGLSNTAIARRLMLSEKIVRHMRPTSGRGARPR